ncbi:hypothetical protein DICSQDRAFT_170762 [Dichomitus squalens LYAD-421 SS1]|uniref:Uncharacterized protein n=1 Tax=Dichomitus squalens (strain LYAD-421) TaxID=732165 RepID=R7SYT0_DICSQ|nr:uncharacterized protein DICSQDRAFT_170762 [Dichomitus squalens LYAD-421 SS1]EJF60900.1 hypothetical protein DICSQDRAFT_170762 [Dichomitus squalens LYAD-421 SS1]
MCQLRGHGQYERSEKGPSLEDITEEKVRTPGSEDDMGEEDVDATRIELTTGSAGKGSIVEASDGSPTQEEAGQT